MPSSQPCRNDQVTLEPMMVIGRVLPAPGLQAKNSSLLEPNSYAREVQAPGDDNSCDK